MSSREAAAPPMEPVYPGSSEEPPSSRSGSRWLALLPVAALAVVLYLVPLPYFVFSPGPARDVIPLIKVSERATYPSEGHFLLTSVVFDQANAYEIFDAWLDPAESVVPEGDVLGPGETQEENARRARSQMDTSKIDAAFIALSEVTGYPEQHGEGVLVEQVFADTPAAGKLFAGDVILEVGGRPVDGPDELGARIQASGEGKPLAFTVEAGGETETVTIVPARVQGFDRPVIGISAIQAFPFPLSIDSGEIGGPSAGLMWTLGLIDLLTPGDLTAGLSVAGTGVIGLDGSVGPVGGIEEKVVAAERAGADVFLVPAENADAARSVADEIRIVSVSNYRQALSFLEGQAEPAS